ncbi:hypothetical protein BDN70DRAFT_887080 [Pholiota conissans]|uniref:Uncharacterized protein n=1 Tax=Pholiota conissans TaxID=109636 RepID=A0A9P6CU85_9AGAR|nr:hypothetical protein BDN70DRAFT_887080 [Pholiota conissans]
MAYNTTSNNVPTKDNEEVQRTRPFPLHKHTISVYQSTTFAAFCGIEMRGFGWHDGNG